MPLYRRRAARSRSHAGCALAGDPLAISVCKQKPFRDHLSVPANRLVQTKIFSAESGHFAIVAVTRIDQLADHLTARCGRRGFLPLASNAKVVWSAVLLGVCGGCKASDKVIRRDERGLAEYFFDLIRRVRASDHLPIRTDINRGGGQRLFQIDLHLHYFVRMAAHNYGHVTILKVELFIIFILGESLFDQIFHH